MMTDDERRELIKELLFESDYWKAVITDAHAMSGHHREINNALSELVPLSVSLVMYDPDKSDKIMDVVSKIQDIILESQQNVMNLLHLAEGRYKVIKEKFDAS